MTAQNLKLKYDPTYKAIPGSDDNANDNNLLKDAVDDVELHNTQQEQSEKKEEITDVVDNDQPES